MKLFAFVMKIVLQIYENKLRNANILTFIFRLLQIIFYVCTPHVA